MAFSIQIELNDKLYIRDPQQTKLGKKILQQSIVLIDKIGFEKFTFKKLAEAIESTEASVYRYFENKHKLLIYLVSWYWEWVKFQIDFHTMNIKNPKVKLEKILSVIVESSKENPIIEHIDEQILHRIVIAEASKAYHTKEVDEENQDGFFSTYKSLCAKIADVIMEINPEFPYPRALASTLLEMTNDNIYFAEHLPALTDIQIPDKEDLSPVHKLLEFFAFRLICKD
ncbi:MAG: TetR/AcrR family transcriptional regulator [Saprospiraceae bacterium]